MFILILFIVLSCNEKKQAPEALVTTVIGDVRMGDKKIKSGDVLKNLDSIKTGPKSVCDLQLTGIESNVSIRVKENSEFSLATATQRDSNNVQMKIVSGKIMVNSDKLNSRDNLETITPTVVMAVRGTKYEVEMGSDANGNVAVLDGKVATRVVIPEVENLPPEVRAKSATLKKLDSFLKEKEMVLQTGNATSVSRKQSDTILKETGLGDVLKNADPSKIADDIDTKLSPEKLSEKTAKISDKDLQPEVVQVSPEEMEKKLKEYDEFKPVSKNAIPSSEVKEPEKEVEKPKPEPTKKTEPKIEKKTEAPVNPAPPAKVEEQKVETKKVEEPPVVEKKQTETNEPDQKALDEKSKINLDAKTWGPEQKKATWVEAKKKCDSLGMRLPSKAELLEIYRSQGVFKDWQYINYWTGEEFESNSIFSGKKVMVWVFDMSNGEGIESGKADKDEYIFRCRKK
ncbi:MAG TPA: FecR family protein [Leptospiraceae bacterium]|nr:FecR family protein [Leptospiraceae bacterium]HMX34389.1 FecR family protein [Leptospiraceae bacterium]HMY32935.1 FecR family protein [Leptospiraceae bacterium]HMZ64549.1 FecR family protein [Leptospiraceae bacterium]HNA08214.1 FecR family protein [Leptospiraceae bacterium]